MTVSLARPLGGSAAESAPRAPRTGGRAYSWLSAVACGALALGGCSALLDTEQKQCSVAQDCINLFGTEVPYSCVNDFCERPACGGSGVTQVAADAQCKGLGFPNSICGPELRCRKPDCLTSEECGEGNICDTSSNRCVERECIASTDCGTSPSVVCQAGLCVDSKWGCIMEPDNRPTATMDKATLKLHFGNAIGETPVPGTTAKVCQLPAFDDPGVPSCTVTLPGKATYDDATGILMVTGLTPNVPFRLKIDPPASTGLLGVDFYSQMTVRDVTEVPGTVGTVDQAVLDAMVSNLGTPSLPFALDHALGGMFNTVFDCQGKTADGVSIFFDNNRFPNMTKVMNALQATLYFEGAFPNVERTVTDTGGRFSMVNMPTGPQVPVIARLGDTNTTISQANIRLFPNRIATIHFHPRSYAAR